MKNGELANVVKSISQAAIKREDFEQINENGEIIAEKSFRLKKDCVFNINNFPLRMIKSMQMHAFTYKTENLKCMKYHQTEGISYTDQQWIHHPMYTVHNIKYRPMIIYKYMLI